MPEPDMEAIAKERATIELERMVLRKELKDAHRDQLKNFDKETRALMSQNLAKWAKIINAAPVE